MRFGIRIVCTAHAKLVLVLEPKLLDILAAKTAILATRSRSRRRHTLFIGGRGRAPLYSTKLLTCLLCEFSLILDFPRIIEQVAELFGFVSQLGPLHDAALLEFEVLERTNLVEVILEILNDSGRAILDQVVHDVDGFGNATPLLGLQSQLLPQMLHDDLVVLPVVGVIREQLQLRVGNVPWIFRGTLHEDGAVLYLLIHLILDLVGSLVNLVQHFKFFFDIF